LKHIFIGRCEIYGICSFIGLYFIHQHIYLCVNRMSNASYLCLKCTNLWINELCTILIINSSHVKFVMKDHPWDDLARFDYILDIGVFLVESIFLSFQNLLFCACLQRFEIIPRPIPTWTTRTYHQNMTIWKNNYLKFGEFGPFFCMKNTLHSWNHIFQVKIWQNFASKKKVCFSLWWFQLDNFLLPMC
jgi:hypothetical protein